MSPQRLRECFIIAEQNAYKASCADQVTNVTVLAILDPSEIVTLGIRSIREINSITQHPLLVFILQINLGKLVAYKELHCNNTRVTHKKAKRQFYLIDPLTACSSSQ